MKPLQKLLAVGLCALVILLSAGNVSGWFSVNKHILITVADVSGPYWIDLLHESEAAPLRTAEELALLLPADYDTALYEDALNGYRDADGFASYRLYAESQYGVYAADDVVLFDLLHEGPFTFKIALVLADGTRIVSPAVTITKACMEITYDTTSVVALEADTFSTIAPGPVADPVLTTIWKVLASAAGTMVVIAAELVILFLFGFRKPRTFLTIGLLNLAATVVVFVLVRLLEIVTSDLFPYLLILVVSAIIVLEVLVFTFGIREQRPTRAILFVFASAVLMIVSAFLLNLPF